MAQPFAAPASAFQYQDRDHDRDRDWNLPPQEFRDIQRQGYHDGIDREGFRRGYDTAWDHMINNARR